MVNVANYSRAKTAAYVCTRQSFSKTQYILKRLLEALVVFLVGGTCYYGIELLWRGYSHWAMFLLGGFCVVCIGLLNETVFSWKLGLVPQMAIGAIVITVLEFITGCIVNLYLGWNIWDYSDLPLNILGQICLPFTFAWFFLSLVAIVVDDFIRYKLFDEPKPQYKLW